MKALSLVAKRVIQRKRREALNHSRSLTKKMKAWRSLVAKRVIQRKRRKALNHSWSLTKKQKKDVKMEPGDKKEKKDSESFVELDQEDESLEKPGGKKGNTKE